MEENRLRDEMPDREVKGAPAESSVRVEARERTVSRESGISSLKRFSSIDRPP